MIISGKNWNHSEFNAKAQSSRDAKLMQKTKIFKTFAPSRLAPLR
jgi:hypothetical protein